MVLFQPPKSKRIRKKQLPPSGHFGQLSHEVVLHIFGSLGPRDLFTARQLCSHLKPVADELLSKQITQLNLHPSETSMRNAKQICKHPLWSQGITELVVLQCVPIRDRHHLSGGPRCDTCKESQSIRFASVTRCPYSRPWPFNSSGSAPQHSPTRLCELISDFANLPRLTKLTFSQSSSIPSLNRGPPAKHRFGNKNHAPVLSARNNGAWYSDADVLIGLLSSKSLGLREFEVKGSSAMIHWIAPELRWAVFVPAPIVTHSRSLGAPAPPLRHLTISVKHGTQREASDHSSCVDSMLSVMSDFKMNTLGLRQLLDSNDCSIQQHPIWQCTNLRVFFERHAKTLREIDIDNILFGTEWLTATSRHHDFQRQLADMAAFHQHLPPKITWRINCAPGHPPLGIPSNDYLAQVALLEGVELETDERGAYWDFGKGRSLMQRRQVDDSDEESEEREHSEHSQHSEENE